MYPKCFSKRICVNKRVRKLKAELCTLTISSRKQCKLSDNHVAVKCAIMETREADCIAGNSNVSLYENELELTQANDS